MNRETYSIDGADGAKTFDDIAKFENRFSHDAAP
jgi:hypothetical protein